MESLLELCASRCKGWEVIWTLLDRIDTRYHVRRVKLVSRVNYVRISFLWWSWIGNLRSHSVSPAWSGLHTMHVSGLAGSTTLRFLLNYDVLLTRNPCASWTSHCNPRLLARAKCSRKNKERMIRRDSKLSARNFARECHSSHGTGLQKVLAILQQSRMTL